MPKYALLPLASVVMLFACAAWGQSGTPRVRPPRPAAAVSRPAASGAASQPSPAASATTAPAATPTPSAATASPAATASSATTSPGAATSTAAIALTPPMIGLSEGYALTGYARLAMIGYLETRTAPAGQPSPVLAPLRERQYAAAVTLRDKGAVVGRVIRDDKDLLTNVAAAAMQAMRSELLPDKVDRQVIESLVVEVEVLGPSVTVAATDLPTQILPGLTGAKVTRGSATAYILPSTQYEENLDAEKVRQRGLALTFRAENVRLQPEWELYLSRHYVWYPLDGTMVWLYRGKVLTPAEAMDNAAIAGFAKQPAGTPVAALAAEQVGDFLIRRQDRDGMYRLGDNPPTLAQQLHATLAMAKLAGGRAKESYKASVALTMNYAGHFLKKTEKEAYLSAQGKPDLAATALLCLAVNEMPRNAAGMDMQESLLAALRKSLREDGTVAAGLDGGAAADPTTAAMILTALFRCGKGDELSHMALKKLTLSLDAALKANRFGECVIQAAWLGRAMAAANDAKHKYGPALDGIAAAMASWQHGDSGPLDEVGGIAAPGQELASAPVAMASVMLHEADALLSGRQRVPARAVQKRALHFTYQMTYKPLEAYFMANPSMNLYVGAVRATPAFAQTDVESCAAALEAFVAK